MIAAQLLSIVADLAGKLVWRWLFRALVAESTGPRDAAKALLWSNEPQRCD